MRLSGRDHQEREYQGYQRPQPCRECRRAACHRIFSERPSAKGSVRRRVPGARGQAWGDPSRDARGRLAARFASIHRQKPHPVAHRAALPVGDLSRSLPSHNQSLPSSSSRRPASRSRLRCRRAARGKSAQGRRGVASHGVQKDQDHDHEGDEDHPYDGYREAPCNGLAVSLASQRKRSQSACDDHADERRAGIED